MVDDIDLVQQQCEVETDALIRQVRRNADIPRGDPGECSECGRSSPRLVAGRCAPCRDGVILTT